MWVLSRKRISNNIASPDFPTNVGINFLLTGAISDKIKDNPGVFILTNLLLMTKLKLDNQPQRVPHLFGAVELFIFPNYLGANSINI